MFRARRSPGEPWQHLTPNRTYNVIEGTEIEALNAGGGGYGSPTRRPAESVQDDVRNGLVSVTPAYEHHGVVLTAPTLQLDEPATHDRRAQLERRAGVS
jgi:N-methylhydantoinase B